MKINKIGFTLVELIVVITILAILGTIAFISLQGYSKEARDSVRLSDLNNINKALGLTLLREGKVPKPLNSINLTLSGEIIGYQGDLTEEVLGEIGITNGGIDPLDKNYYSYYVNFQRNKFQVLGFLENQDSLSILNNTYAYNEGRFPFVKGDSIGLILDENNLPIHKDSIILASGEFDFLGTTTAGKKIKAMFTNKNIEYTTPAMLVGGQIQQISKNNDYSQPDSCPENYIPVPGNIEIGQPGFCVGKYEVTEINDSGTLKYITKEGEKPKIGGDFSQDKNRCMENGDGYDIISIKEWLTIIRNIENVDENWSSGIVGEGYIKGGNNGSINTGFSTSTETILDTGVSGNSTQDNLRQLKLSNGEIIWDLVGNVWEIVKPLSLTEGGEMTKLSSLIYSNIDNIYSITLPDTINYHSWENINNEDFIKNYGPRNGKKISQGYGGIRNKNEGNGRFIYVGGDRSGGESENGLYSMTIKSKDDTFLNVGTRCTYKK